MMDAQIATEKQRTSVFELFDSLYIENACIHTLDYSPELQYELNP